MKFNLSTLGVEDDVCVRVVIGLAGNCGVNTAHNIMRTKDPAKSPNLHLLIMDADGALLKKRFTPEVNSEGSMMTKWLDYWLKVGNISMVNRHLLTQVEQCHRNNTML